MATGFGSASHTDHFSFATSDLIMIASSSVPVAQNRAVAEDEWGDVAEATPHGNDAGTLLDATVTYLLKSGSLDLSSLQLGELEAGVVVTSLRLSTNNKGWPELVATGKLGTQTMAGSVLHTFNPSSLTVYGYKLAQLLGYTLTAGNLIGSTYEATVDLAQGEDGSGEPACHGISGGFESVTLELSADETGGFTVTVPSGYTEEQKPGSGDSPQADYPTGTASAWKALTRATE